MRLAIGFLLVSTVAAAVTCRKGPPEPGTLVGGPACFPAFVARELPVEGVVSASWHAGCPLPKAALVVLEATHWTLENTIETGRIVIAKAAAPKLRKVLGILYAKKFPIARMTPVEVWDASDDASMAANNTSAFNCRPMTGSKAWSRHSYGAAIDVNPLQNPYVRGATIAPPEGRKWLDRRDVRPGLITADGPVVKAFSSVGWQWGGRWAKYQDFQHFSADGR